MLPNVDHTDMSKKCILGCVILFLTFSVYFLGRPEEAAGGRGRHRAGDSGDGDGGEPAVPAARPHHRPLHRHAAAVAGTLQRRQEDQR